MSDPAEIVIVDGSRTPFCKMGSDLAAMDAVGLGAAAVKALMARVGVSHEGVDEVIFGCVCQPFDAANIARVIALRSGFPDSTPAFTVQRNCASGMEAITTAANKIHAGRGEVFVVGGTESMSHVPFLYRRSAVQKFSALGGARSFGKKLQAMLRFRPRDFSPVIGLKLGLADPVAGMGMGETAELLAREFDISRAEQDAFANRSQHRAAEAQQKLAEEISPVFPEGVKHAATRDNGVRDDSSTDKLAKLRPAFDRKYGTVTAGNSSQISDGAVALLVTTAGRASKEGWQVLGTLIDHAFTGCDPKRMGLGPVTAIQQLHQRTGAAPKDCEVVEINEAFAAQVLAVQKALAGAGLEVSDEQLNPNGGAVALGHPVGATGARLVLTVLNELKRRGGGQGIASLCVGGGQGGAVLLRHRP